MKLTGEEVKGMRRKEIRKMDLEYLDEDAAGGVYDLICPKCGTLVARAEGLTLPLAGTIEARCWYCLAIASDTFESSYRVIKGFTVD